VNLGLGIAVLKLLPQMALLVGDFDQELCHALSCAGFKLSVTFCCQSPYLSLPIRVVRK
jgi:hypothetical protein